MPGWHNASSHSCRLHAVDYLQIICRYILFILYSYLAKVPSTYLAKVTHAHRNALISRYLQRHVRLQVDGLLGHDVGPEALFKLSCELAAIEGD